jgi:hypothetical protein
MSGAHTIMHSFAKLVSMLTVNRLGDQLQHPNQRAFIEGFSIQDNFILAGTTDC